MRYNIEEWENPKGSHKIVLDSISSGSSVLELGPATGYMTRYMAQKLMCHVTAVELDFKMAELAKPYCRQMVVGDIETMEWTKELEQQKYDHIVCADVLEHLKNPNKVLMSLKELLTPNGTIIISIPNIAYSGVVLELLKGEFNYRPIGILDETHLRFFTRSSFINMIEQCGFCLHDLKASVFPPEWSEFQLSYKKYPYSVQKAVWSRDDTDVYQYIGVIGKGKREDVHIPKDFCAFDKEEPFWLRYFSQYKATRYLVKRIRKTLRSIRKRC